MTSSAKLSIRKEWLECDLTLLAVLFVIEYNEYNEYNSSVTGCLRIYSAHVFDYYKEINQVSRSSAGTSVWGEGMIPGGGTVNSVSRESALMRIRRHFIRLDYRSDILRVIWNLRRRSVLSIAFIIEPPSQQNHFVKKITTWFEFNRAIRSVPFPSTISKSRIEDSQIEGSTLLNIKTKPIELTAFVHYTFSIFPHVFSRAKINFDEFLQFMIDFSATLVAEKFLKMNSTTLGFF